MFEETEIKRLELGKGAASLKDKIVKEVPLTIKLDGEEFATLLASPQKLKELAVGYLYVEGIIKGSSDLKSVELNPKAYIISIDLLEPIKAEDWQKKRVLTSGCGKNISFYNFEDFKNCPPVESDLKVRAKSVLALMNEFQKRSEIFRETGGVHSAALCESEQIISFTEDIGRHNAFDKIVGELILSGISPKDKFLLSSGRISSEMLLKCARIGIPIVVSRSAPTDMAVRLGKQLIITLAGFARGNRMNIYSGGGIYV